MNQVLVMPANAGIQRLENWTPASAGVTDGMTCVGLTGGLNRVMPANAGIQMARADLRAPAFAGATE